MADQPTELTLTCWTRVNGQRGKRTWTWAYGDDPRESDGTAVSSLNPIIGVERLEVITKSGTQLILWASPFEKDTQQLLASTVALTYTGNSTPVAPSKPRPSPPPVRGNAVIEFALPVRCLLGPPVFNSVPTMGYLQGNFQLDDTGHNILLCLLQLTGFGQKVPGGAVPPKAAQKTLPLMFIDDDGVVVDDIRNKLINSPKNQGQFLPPMWTDPDLGWPTCPSAQILRVFSTAEDHSNQAQFVPHGDAANGPLYLVFRQTGLAPIAIPKQPDPHSQPDDIVPMPFGLSQTESATGPAWWETAILTQRPSEDWLNLSEQPDSGDFDWRLEISGITGVSVGQAWGRSVIQPLMSSLRTVRDNLRITAMPDWEATAAANACPWTLRAMVTELAEARAQGVIDYATDLAWNPEDFRLFPEVQFAACFYFYGLPNVAGRYLKCTGQIQPLAGDYLSDVTPVDDDTSTSRGPGVRFRIIFDPITNLTDSQDWRFRLGALEMALGGPSPDFDSVCKVRTRSIPDDALMPRRAEDGRACPGAIPHIETLEIYLAVCTVAPGAQDRLPLAPFDPDNPTDKLESPIIIELAAPDNPAAGYILHASEYTTDKSNSDFISQSLKFDLSLRVKTSAPSSATYLLVLDPQPFSVFLVVVPPLVSTLDNVAFATWQLSADKPLPSWQYRLGNQPFGLILPPQAVGETMEKGKPADGYPDLDETTAADFRFSPPAVLSLDPSYYDQSFSEMPWNLRRLLGYPGQRAAGPWLVQAKFELLYGLTTTLNPSYTHFSEIFARLGFPVQQLTGFADLAPKVKNEFQIVGQTAWEAIRTQRRQDWLQWLSRLGVYELWREDAANGIVFTDPEVSGSLRPQADLKYPIQNATLPPNSTAPNKAQGLAGSYAWAFESQNIYEQLWRSPNSSSAELANPLFSALGGYGDQTMRFCNDLTSIISKTAMGRISTLRIERLGRIGVLWNRAKHVIIYERTVLRTDQFKDEQDSLKGRMVLRKTQEYVELLQPDRDFPEFGASDHLSSFVRGISFTSKKINVDSRWGADVSLNGALGWKVPLWNLSKSPTDSVYPLPQVSLLVATGQVADPQTGPAQILNPEILNFYTSTLPGDGKDTDAWAEAYAVDYDFCPKLSTPTEKGVNPSDLNLNWGGKSDIGLDALPASYHRFTFRLAPTGNGSSLTFARSDQIIGAMARTVSLMRGVPTQSVAIGAQPDTGVGQKLSALTLNIEDAVRSGKLQGLVDAITLPLAGPNLLSDLTTKAGNEVTSFIASCAIQAEQQIQGAIKRSTDTAQSYLLQQFITLGYQAPASTLNTTQLFATIHDSLDELDNLTNCAFKALATINDFLKVTDAPTLKASLNARIDKISTALASGISSRWSAALVELTALRYCLPAPSTNAKGLDALLELLQRLPENALDPSLDGLIATFATQLGLLSAAIDGDLNAMQTSLKAEQAVAAADFATLKTKIGTWIDANFANWQAAAQNLSPELGTILTLFAQNESALRYQINYVLDAETSFRSWTQGVPANQLKDRVTAWYQKIDQEISSAFIAKADALQQGLNGVLTTQAVALKAALVVAAKAKVTALLSPLSTAASINPVLVQNLRSAADDFASRFPIPAIVGTPFRSGKDLFLAVCDAAPPCVPNLAFPLDRLRYRFDDALPHVDMTTVKTQLDRLQNEARIRVAGMEYDASQVLDRILPDVQRLKDLKLTDVFKDIGLPIEQLFPQIKLPSLASDKIVVRHFLDAQSGRAGVEASVDLPLGGESVVFSEGPVVLTVQNARFYAKARLSASVGGQSSSDASSYVQADWTLRISGLDLVTFVSTKVEYKPGGRLNFDISPDRIKVNAAMSFINELMVGLGYDSGGFKISFVPNLPTSVEVNSTFDTALPDLVFGTFGISNISMGVLFGVKISMKSGKPLLTLTAGFNLARELAPFNLSIFILGGAGFLEANAVYDTLTSVTTIDVTIGLFASATLAIDFGVAEGSVAIYFGIEVDYHSGDGNLSIGILLIFSGNLSILEIIDASVVLTLEAQYTSGGGLVGTGTLSVSIKICWCFTLSVNESISYSFGSGTSSSSNSIATSGPSADDVEDHVSDYVDSSE